ncbi:decaprenyl-phosphate phosphoribosyltransferase [Geomonas silvestris]|uniref:Decaprenyl-phosphate phosphoribosyltransferase n=1 Tax=Geomonas silvestris TaxID=2740184 RepID=A0A6V8MD70_9BACT|nr:decaprenyl-phosphate phosphoribosyltransferase [Geomonas silvestris]GFO57950.1 decaprenyl-phosphate phosphoribosyltransferase [Geomonas silvestris]
MSYLSLLRPNQWLKNLMLLFPPFLGGQLLNPGVLRAGIVPIASFCLASSSTYILNDIMDRQHDALHPRKKYRPLAAGKVPLSAAFVLAAVLCAAGLWLASRVSGTFFLILVAYLAISVSYSLKLKQLPLVDLFCIASGFLLRLEAGGEAFRIVISDWLFLSVFLLAVFLATGKRLGEKQSLGEEAGGHRKSLLSYPDGFLPGAMYMTGGAVLVTYTQYVIVRHTMIYTVPLCCFGLMRFIMRVQSGQGGDPTESLLKDVPLFIVGLLWAVMVGWGLYSG